MSGEGGGTRKIHRKAKERGRIKKGKNKKKTKEERKQGK